MSRLGGVDSSKGAPVLRCRAIDVIVIRSDLQLNRTGGSGGSSTVVMMVVVEIAVPCCLKAFLRSHASQSLAIML